MKRKDVKIGETYAHQKSVYQAAVPVRVVEWSETAGSKRGHFMSGSRVPVAGFIVEDARSEDEQARGYTAPKWSDPRHLRSAWADHEAALAKSRDADARARDARAMQLAAWGDVATMLDTALGDDGRAYLCPGGDELKLTVYHPETARRILAALEPK